MRLPLKLAEGTKANVRPPPLKLSNAMLADEKLHPLQIERFRAMSPSEKHRVFLGMVKTARSITRSALKQRHPDLSETELDRALAKFILHGQS